MHTPQHAWNRAASRTSTRFSFGLLVALSLVLVAFEWRSTTTRLVTIPAFPLDEPPLELPPVVIIEKTKTPAPAAPRKRALASSPLADPTPIAPDPGPDPDPGSDPGTAAGGDPSPVGLPLDTAVVLDPMPWDGVGVRPFFKDCLVRKAADLDACTEDRIGQHLQHRFRMPLKVRGSLSTMVTFEIDRQGHIGRLVCTPRVDKEVEREIERVVRSLPEFVPGSQGGRPVSVYYRLPVRFTQY